MKYSLGETHVKLIGEGHFIAPNAAVIGNVTLHENSSVWFCCVLRGDAERIEVGAGSNIQDGTVMHADPGFPMVVGKNVTEQRKIDHLMKALDGTPDKSKLGANSILGVSLAIARAGATVCGLPLYRYIDPMANMLPVPLMNFSI